MVGSFDGRSARTPQRGRAGRREGSAGEPLPETDDRATDADADGPRRVDTPAPQDAGERGGIDVALAVGLRFDETQSCHVVHDESPFLSDGVMPELGPAESDLDLRRRHLMHRPYLPSSSSSWSLVLDVLIERATGQCQEHRVHRRRLPVALGHVGLELVGRALGDDPTAVEDDDPAAQPLGLDQVVGREDDRRFVAIADLLDDTPGRRACSAGRGRSSARPAAEATGWSAGLARSRPSAASRGSSARSAVRPASRRCRAGPGSPVTTPSLSRASSPYRRAANIRFSIGLSFLKNAASTLTRLMSRLTASSSRSRSWPKTVTEPVSRVSRPDTRRMNVDLPEPFAPRTPRMSPSIHEDRDVVHGDDRALLAADRNRFDACSTSSAGGPSGTRRRAGLDGSGAA